MYCSYQIYLAHTILPKLKKLSKGNKACSHVSSDFMAVIMTTLTFIEILCKDVAQVTLGCPKLYIVKVKLQGNKFLTLTINITMKHDME